MKCPIDDSALVMSERAGIEIDYCPQCRGVWLDRGELDKIIERSMQDSQPEPIDPSSDRRTRGGHDSGSSHNGYSNGRGRKKENWLGELFG